MQEHSTDLHRHVQRDEHIAKCRWYGGAASLDEIILAESYWYVFVTSVLAPMVGSFAAVIVAMIIY